MARRMPKMQEQLQTGCALGSISCTCYAGAMGGDYHTLGRTVPAGCSVRRHTGDKVGGTNLYQVDTALTRHYGINLDVRPMMAWTDFWQRILDGHGAVLQLWYRRLRDSRYRGSRSFAGNHAVFVGNAVGGPTTGLAYVFDPLADGRYSGIYNGPGWYPASMLRAAAGELRLSAYRQVGYGRCYAAFTRDITLAANPKPISPISYGGNSMIVHGGVALRSSHRAFIDQGRSLFREPRNDAPVVTRVTSSLASVGAHFYGNAASGWKAVGCTTRNFPDGELRPVVLYIPSKYVNSIRKVA